MGHDVTNFIKHNGLPDPGAFIATAFQRKGADMIVHNNPNNPISSFLLPGAKAQQRQASGEGVTPKLLGDPGEFFAPSEGTIQKRRAALDAATPKAPTYDVASNSAMQQYDLDRLRRGVLSTIFAGSNGGGPAPTTTYSKLGGGN